MPSLSLSDRQFERAVSGCLQAVLQALNTFLVTNHGSVRARWHELQKVQAFLLSKVVVGATAKAPKRKVGGVDRGRPVTRRQVSKQQLLIHQASPKSSERQESSGSQRSSADKRTPALRRATVLRKRFEKGRRLSSLER